MADFSKYSILISVSGTITAKSPLRIGAGRALGIMESDLPVIKNTHGIPVIPGSSLKGFFRGQLQKILLMRMQKSYVDDLLKEIFGGSGESDKASAVLFHEMRMIKGRVSERKHIAINPETGGVSNLFDVECVMDGAVFEGKMLSARNLNPKTLGLIKVVIDVTKLGFGRLGGFKSRGYGEVEIAVEDIGLVFPGMGMNDLRSGFSVEDLIPEEFGSIRVKASDSEFSVDDEKFKAEMKENQYLGVEVKIGKEEAKKFLDSMLRMVKL